MHPTLRPRATALALLLAGGGLSAQHARPLLPKTQLVSLEATKATRAAQAQRDLQARGQALGLGERDELRIQRASVNAQGQTVVRFEQRHEGLRVWGGSAVARVNPEGGVELTAQHVIPAVAPAGAFTLDETAAIARVHRELAPTRPYLAPPTAERIVFPTKYTEGIKFRYNPATKRQEIDRDLSVLGSRPAADHVYAYEVVATVPDAGRPYRVMHLILDAATGGVLRKWDGAQTHAADAPAQAPFRGYGAAPLAPVQVKAPASLRPGAALPLSGTPPAGTAAVGTGHSQYSGTVSLDVNANTTGGFDLIDRTRGTEANTAYWLGGFQGNTTLFQTLDPAVPGWLMDYAFQDQFGSATNVWGDGQTWAEPADYYADAAATMASLNTPTGQTAGVDAHYGMSTTWDFYTHIFNRNGVDDAGTSLGAIVHARNFMTGGRFDNAFWDSWNMVMVMGDGTYPAPGGFNTLTELDVMGHEMSHGVTAFTAGLDYAGESGGLNEATSDIFGTMVEAYATRTPGADGTIPATGTDWEMGLQMGNGTALRTLWKQSKDGMSADNWYAGVGRLDVHWSSGPMNRAFYFLSQGTGTGEKASLYLPGGMSGIGNDKAARIWYKALTEHLTMESKYADAREGAVAAATDLYGAGSPEVAAVENAFAAINVGSAHGQPARTRVSFPVVNPEFEFVYAGQYSHFMPTPIVPQGEAVKLAVTVENNANQAVDWKLGTFLGAMTPFGEFYWEGGKINADGTWTAPNERGQRFGMRAYSKADPLQYGENIAFVVNLDADKDVETDAVDGGLVAINWYLAQTTQSGISPYGNSWVDNFDVQLFTSAFNLAFKK
jgi:Zn-dependent metalloprotease